MPRLPVMLNLRDKRCVVVGGGPVALRRVNALLLARASVEVVAPDIDEALTALPIRVHKRPYQTGDLQGATLVVIASSSREVNDAVHRDAEQAGVLTNRADDPQRGDFTVPAHAHHGPITLAVDTGGASAAASATIRRQLSDALDPAWPVLIERAAEFRSMIQQRFPDNGQRRGRLLKLTDEQAMSILKTKGEDALLNHLRSLTEPDK